METGCPLDGIEKLCAELDAAQGDIRRYGEILEHIKHEADAFRQTLGTHDPTPTMPDKRCDSCGSLLVVPLLTGFAVPPDTDFVCLKCGRPYRWTENPASLVAISSPDG